MSAAFEKILMPDADVGYLPHLDLGEGADTVLQRLITATPWRAESVRLFGKSHPQPRLSAWMGNSGAKYRYSGLDLQPLPWSTELTGIRRRVEAAVGSVFNSVLLNYYRDHRDSMGMHSDDERELGENPVIASLSLGAERTLVFKHKTLREARRVHLRLRSGSLLLMRGATQHCWKHGIDKLSRECGARVNLTFRRIV